MSAGSHIERSEERWMARALQLARRGLNGTDPNPRVGCVIVRNGEAAGEGWHQQAGGPHAEIAALQQAGEGARGAVCYVTLEPCAHTGRTAPCTEALRSAGVRRVVAAMADPNPRVAGRGLAQLEDAGIETACGLMRQAAMDLNPGFISRMRRGRPWMRLKQAASLDGRVALPSGESRWITGEAARADVQRLRARSSAILTGIGTILHDDPRLNVRLDTPRQPYRVILDAEARTPPDARLFEQGGDVIVFAAEDTKPPAALQKRARIEHAPRGEGGLNLAVVLRRLTELECNEVHVEAGPALSGALLEAGLVDEWVLYLAPVLLGADALPLAGLRGPESMAERRAFAWQDSRRVGADWRVTLRPQSKVDSPLPLGGEG